MLQIGVISLFPEMFSALNHSIPGKAQDKQLLQLHYWNPRDFTHDKHHTVDDRPYGGGPGMLMKVQPLRDAIAAAKQALGENTPVIYLSPQGQVFNHQTAKATALQSNIIFVCGRYEGIDERLLDNDIDEEWSMGDFVTTGGELPAMLMIDAISRWIPGVIGHDEAAEQDSFAQGLLDHPHYTRPEVLDGQKAPDILLSGDHEAIKRWRMKQSLGKTWLKRPDLVKSLPLNEGQQALLEEFINEQGQKR